MRLAPALLLVAGTFASSVAAQPGGGAPAAQAAGAQSFNARATVAEVRRIIAERYVLPERRPALDAVLAEGLSSGRYIVADPAALADTLNADLARVGHDRHLSFRYDRSAAQLMRQGGLEPDNAAYERQAQRRNYGVRELKVLPGNVRYMAYDGFDWTGPPSAAALETAMRFLGGGEAVIIDLRQNGGGSPEAVQYLVSHFLPAGRDLMTFHMNGRATPDRTATLAEVPAGRVIGKPLYVLISNRTASAAEEFTGHVAGYHLGELVGENTAGAGFRNDLVPVGDGFVLSVSVGRAVLAATGRDWEGVGHAPTIPARVDQALEVAQAHALRRLAAAAAPEDRPRLEAAAAVLAAKVNPVATALPLRAYAGTFGDRIISFQNGGLAFQREGGARRTMIAIGPNRFAFEEDPATLLEFSVGGGSATAFDMVRGDGSRVTVQRTQ